MESYSKLQTCFLTLRNTMQRRGFIGIGTTLAASFSHLDVFAGALDNIGEEKSSGQVDFINDGIELSPKEYANLLMKLIDEGKVSVDNYSKGGVVEELENRFANLLGKESAVFMPTGTLANHIAVRKLANNNRRVIVQERSHFYNDSGDCAQTLSGLNLIPTGAKSVDFSLDDIKDVENTTRTGRVETKIGAIAIETPVRRMNDRMFTFEKIEPIRAYALNNEIKMHLDGARLFVQSAHTKIEPAKYAGLFDTIYTSMYKCFNAPSGAILAGTKKFTESLFHERRMFGGGLPAVWPFAAIALHYADSFMDDYTKAWQNAQVLFSMLKKEERFSVSEFQDGSHIVRLDIKGKNLMRFKDSLKRKKVLVNAPDDKGLLLKINPTINSHDPKSLAESFFESLKDLN
jgi:threonine aldolase